MLLGALAAAVWLGRHESRDRIGEKPKLIGHAHVPKSPTDATANETGPLTEFAVASAPAWRVEIARGSSGTIAGQALRPDGASRDSPLRHATGSVP